MRGEISVLWPFSASFLSQLVLKNEGVSLSCLTVTMEEDLFFKVVIVINNNKKKKVDVGFSLQKKPALLPSRTHTVAVTLGPIKSAHWEQGPRGRLGNWAETVSFCCCHAKKIDCLQSQWGFYPDIREENVYRCIPHCKRMRPSMSTNCAFIELCSFQLVHPFKVAAISDIFWSSLKNINL